MGTAWILIICWLFCGSLGGFLAKMTLDSHTKIDLIFGWAMAISLGPITLAVILLSYLEGRR